MENRFVMITEILIGSYIVLAIIVFLIVYNELSWRKWVVPLLPLTIVIFLLASLTVEFRVEILILAIAILLLSISDFMFENAEGISTLALILGLGHTVIIAGLFTVYAFNLGTGIVNYVLILTVAIITGLGAKQFINEPQELRMPIFVYLVSIILQFAGGLAVLLLGLQDVIREPNIALHFGLWGILLFFSDVIVANRAFPNEGHQLPILGMDEKRQTTAILIIYYTAMITLFALPVQLLTV